MLQKTFIFVAISLVARFALANDMQWTVQKGNLVEKRVFSGEIEARDKIDIRAPSFGWNIASTLSISFVPEDGTQVKKGDIILSFDDSELLSKH
jgi:hypothetical protein